MITLTLKALFDEAVKQRATVIAEGEPLVVVHDETVWHVQAKALANGRLSK